jgi:hypothetical protein
MSGKIHWKCDEEFVDKIGDESDEGMPGSFDGPRLITEQV